MAFPKFVDARSISVSSSSNCALTIRGLDPFALLDNVWVRLADEAANLRQGLAAPVTQRPGPLVDETRGRLHRRALRFRTWLGLRTRVRGLGPGGRLAWLAGARRIGGILHDRSADLFSGVAHWRACFHRAGRRRDAILAARIPKSDRSLSFGFAMLSVVIRSVARDVSQVAPGDQRVLEKALRRERQKAFSF